MTCPGRHRKVSVLPDTCKRWARRTAVCPTDAAHASFTPSPPSSSVGPAVVFMYSKVHAPESFLHWYLHRHVRCHVTCVRTSTCRHNGGFANARVWIGRVVNDLDCVGRIRAPRVGAAGCQGPVQRDDSTCDGSRPSSHVRPAASRWAVHGYRMLSRNLGVHRRTYRLQANSSMDGLPSWLCRLFM